MSEYCTDCGWLTDSHGHYRECTKPKQEAEEHSSVVKLERDLAAALLQISEMETCRERAAKNLEHISSLYLDNKEKLTSMERLNQEQQKKTLMGLWHLLRAQAAGGMPPMIVQGVKLACRNVGMSEDHIASAELGGDTPDYIRQETEKR